MRDAPTVRVPVTPPSGASGALHAAYSHLLGGALVRAVAFFRHQLACIPMLTCTLHCVPTQPCIQTDASPPLKAGVRFLVSPLTTQDLLAGDICRGDSLVRGGQRVSSAQKRVWKRSPRGAG